MKRVLSLVVLLALLLTLAACGGDVQTEAEDHPVLPGLRYVSAMEKRFAAQFDVYYYEGGYKLLCIGDGNSYLIVPEGGGVPEGLESSVRMLRQPLDTLYLAATASLSLFDAIDSLDVVAFTSLRAKDCSVENASAAMERGEIRFAGKYSEPDYELLLDRECSLAVESTMILHAPKVQEMIEQLGIPVFIDYSSYESHPLGRTEWMKVYAAMLDREETAEAVFAGKAAVADRLEDFPPSGKTVALFFIDSSGSVQVRSPDDYISRIIEIAGGENAFSRLSGETNGRANISMTMEEFYATAVNTDYLIYNSSSYGEGIDTMEKMLGISELLADCRAVQTGDVWWVGVDTYQRADKLSDLINDIHLMLSGEEGDMTFLHHMD